MTLSDLLTYLFVFGCGVITAITYVLWRLKQDCRW